MVEVSGVKTASGHLDIRPEEAREKSSVSRTWWELCLWKKACLTGASVTHSLPEPKRGNKLPAV